MKHLIEKNNHKIITASLIAGTITSAAVLYLFMTDEGKKMQKSVSHKIKDILKDIASGIISDKTGISKKTVKTAADHAVE